VLAFIGLKMILDALRSTTDLAVPAIPVWLSLVVIVTVLGITAAVSVYATRKESEEGTA